MRVFLFKISLAEQSIYEKNVRKVLPQNNASFPEILKFTKNTTFHHLLWDTSCIVGL